MNYNQRVSASDRFDRVTEKIEQLLAREEQYEIFLNASPWGILVVDKTFHLVFVNKTFEIMSGYRIDELVGKHIQFLMPPEDAALHTRYEKSYIKAPHARTGNHGLKPRVKCKNGTLLDVEISISPTYVQGEKFFFASVRPLETLYHTIQP